MSAPGTKAVGTQLKKWQASNRGVARVLYAQVNAVGSGGLATITFPGSSNPVAAVPALDSYYPTVGDTVAVMVTEPDLLIIGAVNPGALVSLTPATGWSGTIGYWQDGSGFVHLHGLPVFSGTVTDSSVITTLPSTLFPTTLWRFPSYAVHAGMFLDITTLGKVEYRTATDATPASANPSLDPCIFLPGH